MMYNKRSLLLFVMAVSFGLGAAFLVERTLSSRPLAGAAARLETTRVVVAKADIPMATAFHPLNLEVVDWPTKFLPDGTFSDPALLDGRIPRRPFAAGEVLRESEILPKDSAGGLEAIIQPNHRAISVKVDPIVGVAGFVTPGARVDVLATLRRTDLENKQPYAKAVLQNVRVLAIDQKLEEVRNGEPELVSVVTLEVDPADAEKLTFMAHEGKIQLALRSPADADKIKTVGVSVATLLGSAPRARGASLQVVKGTTVTQSNF